VNALGQIRRNLFLYVHGEIVVTLCAPKHTNLEYYYVCETIEMWEIAVVKKKILNFTLDAKLGVWSLLYSKNNYET
jgi:hypothetical protein